MKKSTLFLLIFGVIAFGFLIADVVLAFLFRGILNAGLPFFLCLFGFGVSMLTACLSWLMLNKKETLICCPHCQGTCSKDDAFCPSCGKKLNENMN